MRILTRVGIENHEDHRFMFQNRGQDAQVIRSQSEYSLSLLCEHIGPPNLCYLLEMSIFEHIVQFHWNTCPFFPIIVHSS